MTPPAHHRIHATTVGIQVLVAALLLSPSVTTANDGELWTEVQLSHALSRGLALRCDITTRYSDESTEPYYRYGELGFVWRVSDHAKVGVRYSHILTTSGESNTIERRPGVDLTLSHSAPGLTLSDRNLVELRFQDSGQSHRYRNKLTVSGPSLMDSGVRPYTSGELFYDISAREVTKQRASAGLEIPLGEALTLDAYYLADFRRSDDSWSRVDVTGVRLACKL
jgi:hypothetical protein